MRLSFRKNIVEAMFTKKHETNFRDFCCEFLWNFDFMKFHESEKLLTFLPLELLSQKGRRILYFGFRDTCFQTYRCPKSHVSV